MQQSSYNEDWVHLLNYNTDVDLVAMMVALFWRDQVVGRAI